MYTDRELLGAAAQAAGYSIDARNQAMRDSHGFRQAGLYLVGGSPSWNPLTNDGDALRLVVKLRIEIEPWIHGDSACARAAVGEILIDEPHYGDDPGRATRRAIVRAAAEMVSK